VILDFRKDVPEVCVNRAFSSVAIIALLALAFSLPVMVSASTKIEVLYPWGPGPRDNFIEDWTKALNERYPDIEVEFLWADEGSAYQKLLTLIAAGTPPDVTLASAPQ